MPKTHAIVTKNKNNSQFFHLKFWQFHLGIQCNILKFMPYHSFCSFPTPAEFLLHLN